MYLFSQVHLTNSEFICSPIRLFWSFVGFYFFSWNTFPLLFLISICNIFDACSMCYRLESNEQGRKSMFLSRANAKRKSFFLVILAACLCVRWPT